MSRRVFIDGEAGTTGLQVHERLRQEPAFELLQIDPAERKDPGARARLLNAADLGILCLADDAARESTALVTNPAVKLIDASTAYRTHPDWVYGLPELEPEHARRIAEATRVSNPGCYPTGFICLLRPLVAAGIVPKEFPVTVNAVSGYTGGGREMIARYEDPDAPGATDSAHRVYGLGLEHKHVDEMRVHSLLAHRPVFVPSVGRYRQGMIVQVPLQLWALPARPRVDDLRATLAAYYAGSTLVSVVDDETTRRTPHLDAHAMHGDDTMRLYVFGNERHEQAVLVAELDNLGKGAAGTAVQCAKLMLGVIEPSRALRAAG